MCANSENGDIRGKGGGGLPKPLWEDIAEMQPQQSSKKDDNSELGT